MTLFVILAGIIVLFGSAAFIGAPYVPSLRREVRSAFTTLYPLKETDVVVDLGSGDGIVLLEAHKHGAYGYGFEINPLLVLISKMRLRGNATIKLGDMWGATFPDDTTLVYAFSVTRDSKKLAALMQNNADRMGHPLKLMTFGAKLRTHEQVDELKAHTLYVIHPR